MPAEVSAAIRLQMGINSRHPLVILKQYGEYRTGTNALRALILENFDNALVLMHVLGNKHGEALNYAELALALAAPDADLYRILIRATRLRPGGVSHMDSFQQMTFVRLFRSDLCDAIRGDTIRFLISTRHPLAWLEAVMSFWEWPIRPGKESWEHSESRAFAKHLCERYNRNHAGWLKLLEEASGRALLVPFESLKPEWERIVRECAQRFPVHWRRRQPVEIRQRVAPSTWDNISPAYEKSRTERIRLPLAPDLVELVRERVDWPLMAHFGYERPVDREAAGAAGSGRAV